MHYRLHERGSRRPWFIWPVERCYLLPSPKRVYELRVASKGERSGERESRLAFAWQSATSPGGIQECSMWQKKSQSQSTTVARRITKYRISSYGTDRSTLARRSRRSRSWAFRWIQSTVGRDGEEKTLQHLHTAVWQIKVTVCVCSCVGREERWDGQIALWDHLKTHCARLTVTIQRRNE